MRQRAGEGARGGQAFTRACLGLPVCVLGVLRGRVLHQVLEALAVPLSLHAGMHCTLETIALVTL